MKKLTLGLTLLMISCGAFIFPGALPAASADARSFETSVNSLVIQSYASRKACTEYRARVMKLDRSGSAAFRSRAAALAAMNGFEHYPGIPVPAGRAYAAAMGNLPSGVDWSWFNRAYGSIQGACAMTESYSGLNRLINSTRVLRFTPAERARIRSATLSFISRNMSQPTTLIVGLVQISLFENLRDSRLVKLDSRSAAELKDLLKGGDQIRRKIADSVRRRKKTTDRQRASDLVFELKSANRLRLRFLPLMGKVK